MSSVRNVFPTLSRGEQAAVWITIVVVGLWLLVGVPTLIGVGWNRTSNVSTTSQASVLNLRTLTEGGFAQQNNVVQNNFKTVASLPSATLNIGGADGNARA